MITEFKMDYDNTEQYYEVGCNLSMTLWNVYNFYNLPVTTWIIYLLSILSATKIEVLSPVFEKIHRINTFFGFQFCSMISFFKKIYSLARQVWSQPVKSLRDEVLDDHPSCKWDREDSGQVLSVIKAMGKNLTLL